VFHGKFLLKEQDIVSIVPRDHNCIHFVKKYEKMLDFPGFRWYNKLPRVEKLAIL